MPSPSPSRSTSASPLVKQPQDAFLITSSCPAYLRAVAKAAQFARDPLLPILIEGETGTGKTVIARHLHSISPRWQEPFHEVPLSGIDDALASSDLFGHVTGAFTGAVRSRNGAFVSANHGTVFLDEIGKASKTVQARLLHAVESGTIRPEGCDRSVATDVRLMAASNVSLKQLVAEGTFLPDLFPRIGYYSVTLPPLRKRKMDIPILVSRSIERNAARLRYDVSPSVDQELMLALQSAPWPGNLRELDAVVLLLLFEAGTKSELTLDMCVDDLAYLRDLAAPRRELTPEIVTDALVRCGGSKSRAAKLLGVHRTTLYRSQKIPDATESSGG